MNWVRHAVWGTILVTVAATPLIIATQARDAFRMPKTLFFQAAMLLVAGIAGAWLLVGDRSGVADRITRHRFSILVAIAAVLWTCVVSLTAVEPATARYAPLTAFTAAVLFVATIVFARDTAPPLIVLFVPAIANSIFTVLQALHLWTPIPLVAIPKGRHYAMGLLGNPDYIGAYLIVPCIAAFAAAIAFRRYRLLLLGVFCALLTGIFFAQSVTATGAIAVSMLSFGIVARSPKARVALGLSVMLITLGIFSYGPTRNRSLVLLNNLRDGNFLEFSSFRLPAFAVAIDMFLERPILGVGPGGYERTYMTHKLEGDERHPEWMTLGNSNFGEAHNDHLQVLAEAGIPGYVLYVMALGSVGWISFRSKRTESEREEFVRLFSFPAVLGFTIVSLAQFPLYLTACLVSTIFSFALAHVWSTRAPA